MRTLRLALTALLCVAVGMPTPLALAERTDLDRVWFILQVCSDRDKLCLDNPVVVKEAVEMVQAKTIPAINLLRHYVVNAPPAARKSDRYRVLKAILANAEELNTNIGILAQLSAP